MSRLSPPAATGALRGLRLEIGDLADVLTPLVHAPRALQAIEALLAGTLLDGEVSRTTKELIALAAASVAGVATLRAHLRHSLSARGVDEAVLVELEAKGETRRLPQRTQRLVFLGRRAALQPALLTDADFAAARREGIDDAELAEIVAWSGTIALLIAMSRALGQAGG